MNWLNELSYPHWLALGTALLILEMFGAGGYLLWIGIAAAATGLLSFILPSLPATLQLLLFAVFAVLTAVYWWYRQRSAARPSDQPGLNMRGNQLIGHTFTVQQAIVDGRGKIKVGDSVWIVVGPDTPAGDRVRVVSQEGAILRVEPL